MSDSEPKAPSEHAQDLMASAYARRRGQSHIKYPTTFVDTSAVSSTGGTVTQEEITKRRHRLNRSFKELFFELLTAIITSDKGDFTASRPVIVSMRVGAGKASPDQDHTAIEKAMKNLTRVREYVRTPSLDENGDPKLDSQGRPIIYEDLELDQEPVEIFLFKADMPGSKYTAVVRHLEEHDEDHDVLMVERRYFDHPNDLRRLLEQQVLSKIDMHGNVKKSLLLSYFFTFFPSYSGKTRDLDPPEWRSQFEQAAKYSAKQLLEREIQDIPAGTTRPVVHMHANAMSDRTPAGA